MNTCAVTTLRIDCGNCGVSFNAKLNERTGCPKCGKEYEVKVETKYTISPTGMWRAPEASYRFQKGL